jgi:hypothetical protein
MTTTAITASCRCCGRQVDDAMQLMLCDGCLDARLARLERTPPHAAGAMKAAALAVERVRALTVGNLGRPRVVTGM